MLFEPCFWVEKSFLSGEKVTKRITLRNDTKGDKEIQFQTYEVYGKLRVFIFAGNAGQTKIPVLGYSDNADLIKFVTELNKKEDEEILKEAKIKHKKQPQ